jgi:uncharacterized protein YwgA
VNDIDRSAILLDLAAQLRAYGSWTGETHVQKAAYLLQQLLGVPSGFKFVLYKHGPFSFDLRDSLNKLETWGCIQTEDQPYPYGPKIVEGPASGKLRAASKDREEYVPQIQFVAHQLGKANVSELERVATALFIELDPNVKPEDRPDRLVSLKPHISHQDAPNAFGRLGEIRSAALNAGFSVQGSKVETARG